MTGVPKGERMNISFIGRINAGKSSVINSLIGQDISIVSEFPGTTTDPVAKRYELIPIGPVTIYDTAGYDD
ncbi:MAG: 50S ribosome-binding GTPase, partial [Candidatus Cloacimonetes bacterium]|nr:50S ribosome-binding GTPase [Candidatus Cloacimonadota bacterium]